MYIGRLGFFGITKAHVNILKFMSIWAKRKIDVAYLSCVDFSTPWCVAKI